LELVKDKIGEDAKQYLEKEYNRVVNWAIDERENANSLMEEIIQIERDFDKFNKSNK
jgi:hypothetical protein